MGLFNLETECEACKRKRQGLTWTGEPPKCEKHSKYNKTWVSDGVL